VLDIMLAENLITAQEHAEAKAEEPKLNPEPPKTTARLLGAPYFVDYVLETLRRELPDVDLKEGGYTIQTTLDWELQKLADAELKKLIAANRSRKVTTGGFVLMDADGRVLALAGGVDYNKNQFNAIVHGLRQPGSAFKPFVYATAMATGRLRINDSVSNAPIKWWDEGSQSFWQPKNAGAYNAGSYPLRTAFALSINRPAIHTTFDVGPETVAQYSREAFGFRAPLTPVPSLALGASEVFPIEMAQAYSVFMLRGDRATAYPVVRVRRNDHLIKEFHPRVVRNVFDPRISDDVDSLMRHTVTNGTARTASRIPNARGKTGTTSDHKDAWFCGYADGLVGIGWVANEVPREGRPPVYMPMQSSVYGGTVTIQMWSAIMAPAHKKYGKQWAEQLENRRKETAGQYIPEPEFVIEREPVAPPPPLVPPITDDGPPVDLPEREGPVPPPAGPAIVDPPAGPRRLDPGALERQAPPTTAPPRTNNPPRRNETAPPPVENVQVEICADSRLRANMYCPETVSRLFQKGREPARGCNLHGPL
jgi:penicillin-binding protein 1A